MTAHWKVGAGRRRVYALQERLRRSQAGRAVLDLLCAGLSCRAVADRLVVSPAKNTECHRTSVMRKLHCAGLKEFEALVRSSRNENAALPRECRFVELCIQSGDQRLVRPAASSPATRPQMTAAVAGSRRW